MKPEELKLMMPFSTGEKRKLFCEPLSEAMSEFEINTPKRIAAFVAQIAHESGSLQYVRELADGFVYEGRGDLGNTSTGDGVKYKGRGLLQITGKANYRTCGSALGLDLVAFPALLEEPRNACRSAGWFWKTRNLNRLADADQFGALSRAINGGWNGLDDRISHWLRARKVVGL